MATQPITIEGDFSGFITALRAQHPQASGAFEATERARSYLDNAENSFGDDVPRLSIQRFFELHGLTVTPRFVNGRQSGMLYACVRNKILDPEHPLVLVVGTPQSLLPTDLSLTENVLSMRDLFALKVTGTCAEEKLSHIKSLYSRQGIGKVYVVTYVEGRLSITPQE